MCTGTQYESEGQEELKNKYKAVSLVTVNRGRFSCRSTKKKKKMQVDFSWPQFNS